MDELKLGECDYRFMNVIWNNQPLQSGELVSLCATELGWKKSTVYTVLKKLCDKGFAKNEGSTVTALIPRERVRAFESERVVNHTFDGSLPGFLASFLDGKTISEKEALELKQLIDSHREE